MGNNNPEQIQISIKSRNQTSLVCNFALQVIEFSRVSFCSDCAQNLSEHSGFILQKKEAQIILILPAHGYETGLSSGVSFYLKQNLFFTMTYIRCRCSCRGLRRLKL